MLFCFSVVSLGIAYCVIGGVAPIQQNHLAVWLGSASLSSHSTAILVHSLILCSLQACMTPARSGGLLLLHLIGRNPQRQQPLTAQFSMCLTLVTRCNAPSFATVLDVESPDLTLFCLFDSLQRPRLVVLERAKHGVSAQRACKDGRQKPCETGTRQLNDKFSHKRRAVGGSRNKTNSTKSY